MLYCLKCINSIIPNKTPVLKRQNAEINISTKIIILYVHIVKQML